MDQNSNIKRIVLRHYRLSRAKTFTTHIDKKKSWDRIQYRIRIRRIRKVTSSVAAILILALLGGFFWYRTQPHDSGLGAEMEMTATAFLTLSNGVCVDLSDADSSRVIALNHVIDPSVVIPETSTTEGIRDVIKYDTLIVKDKILRVLLQDSTSVVIDRHSTLIFPSDFSQSRTVELTGHAYFIVHRSGADLPVFKVKLSDMIIEDRGTVFDVSDKGDCLEAVLLEGEIAVQNSKGHHAILSEGQCVQCHGEEGLIIKEIDPKVYKAWAEDEFYFKALPLEEVLQEVADFYDMSYKVVQSQRLGHQVTITGVIKRTKDIVPVLSKLEKSTGLSFTIDNKIIIVR